MKSKTFFKSRSNQNLINFRKKKNLSLKYTNAFLFERREYQLFNTQKSKKFVKRNGKIFNTFESNFIPNNNKNIFAKNNFFTINSFSSNQTRNLTLKNSMSYTTKKNNIPKLFLTGEALLHNKIIKKSEKKNLSEKNSLINDLNNIYQKEKQSKTNINFLLSVEKDLQEYRERNKENNYINKKIDKLHKKEKSRRGMITNINTFKYMKSLIKLKKQREQNKRENRENEIEFIQEKINSLNKTLKLLNYNFMNRISDYLRHLDSMKNREYTKNINLLKEKMDIKREIVRINLEIEKTKQKKEDILRWVYLQIKVKERKLILPKYYKKIIEANKAEILHMEAKFDDNFNHLDIKRERDDKLRAKKLKRSFIQKKSFSKYHEKTDNITPLKRSKNGFLYRSEKAVFSRMKIKAFNILENNSFEKKKNNSNTKVKIYFNDKNKEKEFEYLTKDEFNKIVFWKFRPIYQTVDEFMESLNYLDLQNIQLLEYYNQTQFKIYCLRQELIQVINSRDKYDINIDEQLVQKTSEVEKLRNKYTLIYKTYEKISENKNINKIKKEKNPSSKGFTERDINKIYNKLNEIFDNCKEINNQQLTELIYYNIKSEKTKEGEMIYLIEYIECSLDFLFEKISSYKRDKDLKEKVHEESVKIEKQHRLEKPNKQRLEDRQKHINLIQKVMKKSQQNYITPTRHIDLVHYDFRVLGRNKKKKNLNNDDFPNLNDFMKNPNIINNNEESSFNKE